jgi:hypothetical protein
MTTTISDPLDRLYKLLPAIYRMRYAEQQYPLQALLRVIAEQVIVVETDIEQLYEDWFIETAEEWVVPYIAGLIGYRPGFDTGLTSDGTTREERELNRIRIPRREVANTIRYRRRKGTLALLELLAADVAGWPARAVEFFKMLGRNQNINHLHLQQARTVDLRQVEDLDLIDGPFDPLAHGMGVRRINSHRTIGRYNIPSVGVFVWRLKPYSVTRSPAYCAETAGPHCYSFSVLGQDAPLFIKPEPETEPTHIAEELNVPAAIRRVAFFKHSNRFYGPDKSLAIWAEGWEGFDSDQPIPVAAIVPADLSNWQYVPPLKHIAVDPVLGRFAFPPSQLPKKSVRVTYHYAFSADMGGGEYPRGLVEPSTRQVEVPDPEHPDRTILQTVEPAYYRVGRDQTFHRISEALRQWTQDKPWDAVIELTDSKVYVEPISITLEADRTLQLRAADRTRPIIRLLDWQTDLPVAVSVTMGRGSRFTMDGLLVTGRPLQITGPDRATRDDSRAPICGSTVVIRHCTLVPGWGLDCDCEPMRPAEPSLEVFNIRATLRIEQSILGSIQIHEDEVNIDPIPIRISDSILDATDPQKEAIGAPGFAVAHAVLTIQRCTVFGIVNVRAVQSADDSIFLDCLNVARRQLGCMRFCYVPPGCRTPRRYHCQPDLVVQAVRDKIADPAEQARAIACEQQRVRPQFTSTRYGNPGYAQLGLSCPDEIERGAGDESEVGAFHDLFQPQREANLRARLEEYTPAGIAVGLLYAD